LRKKKVTKRTVKRKISVKKAKKAVSKKKKTVKTVKKKPLKVKKAVSKKKVKSASTKLAKKAKPKPPKPGKKKKKEIEEVPKKRGPTADELKLRRQLGTILGDAAVRQELIEIGGENALAIVRNFYSNHSDEELAKKLKIKISDVRATLNKLHNEGLVHYMREKDSETGWYSYSWSLNQDRMQKWADSQTNRLNELCEGGVDYYFCPSCGMSSITDFESASNWEFRCERCNRLLEFMDEKRMGQLMEKFGP
jgi:transcription initiation factor TFIIE subunit alpha